mmetsp:Transcript_20558/g.65865  ORF Transcript_20558/g.65865 Transcript_20558/m.65865 type:complete len:219 (+) Transcript_20558:784-1440(+)
MANHIHRILCHPKLDRPCRERRRHPQHRLQQRRTVPLAALVEPAHCKTLVAPRSSPRCSVTEPLLTPACRCRRSRRRANPARVQVALVLGEGHAQPVKAPQEHALRTGKVERATTHVMATVHRVLHSQPRVPGIHPVAGFRAAHVTASFRQLDGHVAHAQVATIQAQEVEQQRAEVETRCKAACRDTKHGRRLGACGFFIFVPRCLGSIAIDDRRRRP